MIDMEAYCHGLEYAIGACHTELAAYYRREKDKDRRQVAKSYMAGLINRLRCRQETIAMMDSPAPAVGKRGDHA